LMRCSIFTYSRIRQKNTTQSHSNKAQRQTNWHRDESNLFWFEKIQGRLPFTHSPLLQVSPHLVYDSKCSILQYFHCRDAIRYSQTSILKTIISLSYITQPMALHWQACLKSIYLCPSLTLAHY
jgi:hypothetical protein